METKKESKLNLSNVVLLVNGKETEIETSKPLTKKEFKAMMIKSILASMQENKSK